MIFFLGFIFVSVQLETVCERLDAYKSEHFVSDPQAEDRWENAPEAAEKVFALFTALGCTGNHRNDCSDGIGMALAGCSCGVTTCKENQTCVRDTSSCVDEQACHLKTSQTSCESVSGIARCQWRRDLTCDIAPSFEKLKKQRVKHGLTCLNSDRKSAEDILNTLVAAGLAMAAVAFPEFAPIFTILGSVMNFMFPSAKAPDDVQRVEKALEKMTHSNEQFNLDIMLSNMTALHMRIKDTIASLHGLEHEAIFNATSELDTEVDKTVYECVAKMTVALSEDLYSSDKLVDLAKNDPNTLTKRVSAVENFLAMYAAVEIDRANVLGVAADELKENETLVIQSKTLHEKMKKVLGPELGKSLWLFKEKWTNRVRTFFSNGIEPALHDCTNYNNVYDISGSGLADPGPYLNWRFHTCKTWSDCSRGRTAVKFLTNTNDIPGLRKRVDVTWGMWRAHNESEFAIKNAQEYLRRYEEFCPRGGCFYMQTIQANWSAINPCTDLKTYIDKFLEEIRNPPS